MWNKMAAEEEPKTVRFNDIQEDQNEGGFNSAPSSPSAAPAGKPANPFAKFKQMEQTNSPQRGAMYPGARGHRLVRQASVPVAGGSAPPPIQTAGAAGQKSEAASTLVGVLNRTQSSAKEMLLIWAQQRVNDYPNVNVTNFSTSWNDGLAFCALLHYYYPEAFDFSKLDPEQRRYNFTLAFKAAEEFAGLYPLLDVDDMVKYKKPDWKCVFTYVQTFYRRFRNGRDPPSPTRTLTVRRSPSPEKSTNSVAHSVQSTVTAAVEQVSIQ